MSPRHHLLLVGLQLPPADRAPLGRDNKTTRDSELPGTPVFQPTILTCDIRIGDATDGAHGGITNTIDQDKLVSTMQSKRKF